MASEAMTDWNLHETLKSLFRKEVSIETFTEDLYRGSLVYVGDPEDSRKRYITIEDILQGKRRVKFSEIQRVWKQNKTLWRSHSHHMDSKNILDKR